MNKLKVLLPYLAGLLSSIGFFFSAQDADKVGADDVLGGVFSGFASVLQKLTTASDASAVRKALEAIRGGLTDFLNNCDTNTRVLKISENLQHTLQFAAGIAMAVGFSLKGADDNSTGIDDEIGSLVSALAQGLSAVASSRVTGSHDGLVIIRDAVNQFLFDTQTPDLTAAVMPQQGDGFRI